MSKRIVFNAIFFELATVMYWCLLGNSGSIASKLSIIAINPGHSYVKSRWLSRFYCPKAYLHHFHLWAAHHSVWSFAILYLFIMSLDKKMHLHKFAPGQMFCKNCENWGVNVGKCPICLAINLHPQSFLVCKCVIYHLCPIFTPQFLHFCDIFTRSKFVQIHFFPPVGNAVDLITVLL